MTESVSFSVSDMPPDAADSTTDTVTSNDPTCEVCGTPLSYSGRGRKPKYCDDHKRSTSTSRTTSTGRRSTRDVEAAMAALSSGHTVVQFAMSLVSLEAGQVFEISRPTLDERNRAILESDPALAKRIAAMASKGGGAALLISHVIAIAPAAAIAGRQMRASAVTRAQKREAQSFEATE